MLEGLKPFIRRYWPAGLICCGLLFWSAWASIQAHKIIYERPVSEPYEKAGVQSCTTPGWCHKPRLRSKPDGTMTTEYAYVFDAACPGTKRVKLTVQDVWYERRNGKTGERTKTLGSEDIGKCQA